MPSYYIHNGSLYRSDELKHWKYIKKKRVNGKWRYYYKNDELDNATRRYENAKGAFYTLSAEKNSSWDKIADLNNQINSTVYDSSLTPKDKSKKLSSLDAERKKEKARYETLEAKAFDAAGKHDAALKRLERVKLKTIVPETINKGVKAVSKLLSSLFKKNK